MKKKREAFTLIELLVIIGIVAVLSVAVVLVLNPGNLLAKARDSVRSSDMTIIKKSLSLAETELESNSFGESNVVYLSLPQTNNQNPGDCAEYSLPALPEGWRYQCAPIDTYRKADGTGWIPVNFSTLSFGTPISKLPVDPVNNTDLRYTYVKGSFELTARLEAKENRIANKDTKGALVLSSGEHPLLSITPLVIVNKLVDSSHFSW